MTEYGRSPGSEPWHPEDPLYGDQGWRGQQGQPGPAAPYGAQQYQPQQPPQQQYGGDYQDPNQQQYGGQGHPQQYADPHYAPQQQYGEQQYATGSWDTGQQYATGGWDTGQQPVMPYDPSPGAPYGGQTPDLYGTPDAYPPPQPPGHRAAPGEQRGRRREPEPATDWDAEPEEENHPFFTGADGDGGDSDGYDDEPEAARGGGGRDGRGRPKKQKKGRSGMACLIVAVVLAGGVGGAGYVGYQFWQDKFGAAPDFAGQGSGSVQVEIPQGATGAAIGNLLKDAGVVKSVDAFVAAQLRNPNGDKIQAGVYDLKKEMSAASAVELLLGTQSRNSLIIPEGKRNAWIYEQIDTKLGLDAGTTKKVAEDQAEDLGLPEWATGHPEVKDPLEGFLFPASYPVKKGAKPEDVLAGMVTRANEEYTKANVVGKAKSLGLEGPWELVTVASLVQAEGKTKDDYRKMAEVVYNRLKPTNTETNQLLQFDSAFNYLRGESEIEISESEINSNKDPYNTYTRKGLTPGPIGNPGAVALNASMSPTKDGWMYFVATDGKHRTEFAKTHAQFQELKDKFNAQQGID
ncbi:endolytic transglycosylase MltG [Streptomyces sp. NPDC007861]|uniref:endolytic transglycosylase MltG n=1 Tax=Streptomyces sp. NPDC007861 TaxID=3154893 RepID=UPI003401F67E